MTEPIWTTTTPPTWIALTAQRSGAWSANASIPCDAAPKRPTLVLLDWERLRVTGLVANWRAVAGAVEVELQDVHVFAKDGDRVLEIPVPTGGDA